MKRSEILSVTIASILLFTSCQKLTGAVEAANEIPLKMDALNEGMGSTNSSIRLQKLAIALDQLMKKENQEFLSPIPGDMMAPGKLLAETLTADEAVELIYVKLKNVNENTYADRHPEDPEKQNVAQLFEFSRSKMALLLAVQIVSTFLPDPVLEQIINKEVIHAGRFRKTALGILAMRADFYHRVMLKASLLNEPLSEVGSVEKAVEYNAKVDFIARLKFANRIGLKITGFPNQEFNDEVNKHLEKFDATLAAQNWVTIKDRASSSVEIIEVSGGDANDQAEMQNQRVRLKNQLDLVERYIQSWPPVPAFQGGSDVPPAIGAMPSPVPSPAPVPAEVAPVPTPTPAPAPGPVDGRNAAPTPVPVPTPAPVVDGSVPEGTLDSMKQKFLSASHITLNEFKALPQVMDCVQYNKGKSEFTQNIKAKLSANESSATLSFSTETDDFKFEEKDGALKSVYTFETAEVKTVRVMTAKKSSDGSLLLKGEAYLTRGSETEHIDGIVYSCK